MLADPKAGAKGSTCASAINSQGVIVGWYGSGQLHGFVLDRSRYTTIDEPQAGHGIGEGTIAVGINDTGVIAGYYFTSKLAERGFMLRDGKFTSVSFPGPAGAKKAGTVLNGISDNDTMTGVFTDRAGDHVSFADHNGKFRRISVPGAKLTSAACISLHSGLITGDYQTSLATPSRGFILHNGRYRTLQAPQAKKDTFPQCGNDHGQVAGFIIGIDDTSSGFLFTPRK